MKKLVIALSIAASLAGFSYPASADNGEISRNAVHKNWYSLKVCYSTHCSWRATTFSVNSDRELFVIEFFADGRKPELSIIQKNLNHDAMFMRDENKEYLSQVRFRVDTQPIIDTAGKPVLDGQTRTLVWHTSSRPEIIEDIRNGNTLRIQTDLNGVKTTHVFSLSGAAAAIDRAQRNVGASHSSTPLQRPRSADDAFF